MADPQPKPATAKELIGEQINAWGTFDYDRLPEEVLAETILSTLTAAGFRIVPPGWRVVKLERDILDDAPEEEFTTFVILEEWDG